MSRALEPFPKRALGVLSFVFAGLHHVDMHRVKWRTPDDPNFGRCEYSAFDDLSTFDYARLTMLVVAAHDLCVRVEIQPSGPRHLKIVMWPRVREGDMAKRHPELEAHAAELRARFDRWYEPDPYWLTTESKGSPRARVTAAGRKP